MDKRQLFALLVLSMPLSTVTATDLDISSKPLFLGEGVEPNIMMTLDDSGSMQWEVMPAENQHYTTYMFPMPSNLYGGTTYVSQVPNFDDDNVHNFFQRSAHNNVLFYDPDITYEPWSESDGSSMDDADPTAALYNPADSSVGSLDLTSEQTGYACWFSHTSSLTSANGDPCYGNYTYWPITYYIYNSGSVTDSSSYTKVQITSSTSSSTTYTSPSGTVRTRDEEIQNFANWFQYYRSRILSARAGIGRAFAQQGTGMRVGFAAINEGSATIDGVSSSSALVKGLREFSGTGRTDFFDQLYGRVINNYGTPLRSALNNVGKYFERSDDEGPWSETPGTTSTADHLSCRQSYNILMTDGYWNGSSPELGNVDNTAGSTISGPNNSDYKYSPANPYKDDWSNTLADVGMYYWKRDLRSDVDNEVATNSSDPAFWQHLVNFTVGLGVDGTLDPDNDLGSLTTGALDWPEPSADAEENIDDLWHTAVNSRGEYFSASDPDTFADSLADILTAISDRSASASATALSVDTLIDGGMVYQAIFNSDDWSGDLQAYEVASDGSVADTASWSASEQVPAAASRVILTYDGSSGQPFSWTDISTDQQTLLGSQAVLNYIRGDQSNEIANGGTYRTRTSVLGDIVHSSPQYIGAPDSSYADNWGSGADENDALYSSFESTYADRQAMVYVGANDGMMHAFNADTGVEVFAYVPNVVMSKLPDLTSSSYSHEYFVDGQVTVADAFFNSAWHSVLVGSLRAGGQGIYAIDVTDPSKFSSEDTGKAKILWEFTDTDDRDMGYTFGMPSIVRLQNGKWAAVFSGGYNNTEDDDGDGGQTNDSKTGDAVLYIVDLEDGSLIKKFDTKVGADEDPAGTSRPNGLATPFVADFNNDDIADAIYAGDLFGNVWKIDISASSSGSWDFAYKSGSTPQPVFTACFGTTCGSSNIQPITTQVQVTRHSTTKGYLLVFGTGKYFETGDNSTTDQVTQSLYGIWDKDADTLTSFDRSDLLQQEIIYETTSNDYSVRVSTDNSIDWSSDDGWYLDLVNTQDSNTDNGGERVIGDAIIRNDHVIFTTAIPSDDDCSAEGTSWIMALDVDDGSRLSYSPFDLNGDGLYTTAEYVNVGDIDGDGVDDYVPVSGVKKKGMTSATIVRKSGTDTDIIYGSSTANTYSDDDSESPLSSNAGPTTSERTSWRQLDFIFR